jgi:hypothetical protein
MSIFADIRTVYQEAGQRNIKYLNAVYDSPFYLFELINDLFETNISKGAIWDKKVFIKPNWVRHNVNVKDELCLHTNHKFLLVALEVLLKWKPRSVLIGDAPIEGCQWHKLLSQSFIDDIKVLSLKYSVPIIIKDFRRRTFDPNSNKLNEDINPYTDYTLFDLGEKSFLEPVTNNEKKLFRVMDYDFARLAETHKKGIHKYIITKELLDSDFVITMPKMKTHQKTGLTNALKILVGLVGDKDYLPHHRKGGTKEGGDCYPGWNIFRKTAEYILDKANRKIGKPDYNYWRNLAYSFWRYSLPKKEHTIGAGWYGNDTTWRMVFDIYHIAVFGKSDGTLTSTPQREIYSLCDGIIGGQGNGPVHPDPLALGVVALTNNAPLIDMALGYLFGLEVNKIPLLREADKEINETAYSLLLNKVPVTFDKLKDYSVKANMPPGWINYDK